VRESIGSSICVEEKDRQEDIQVSLGTGTPIPSLKATGREERTNHKGLQARRLNRIPSEREKFNGRKEAGD